MKYLKKPTMCNSHLKLSTEEWQTIRKLHSALSLIEFYIKKLERDNYVTISLVLPAIQHILKKNLQVLENTNEIAKPIIQQLINDIKERWKPDQINNLFYYATYFTPT